MMKMILEWFDMVPEAWRVLAFLSFAFSVASVIALVLCYIANTLGL